MQNIIIRILRSKKTIRKFSNKLALKKKDIFLNTYFWGCRLRM